jgi:hypothetical protein
MTEAQESGVIEEAAAPMAEEMGIAQEVEQAQEGEQQVEEAKPSDQELNFRALREKTEQLQRENSQQKEMLTAFQEMMLKANQPKAPEPEPEEDILAGYDLSDVLTVEQAVELGNKIAAKTSEASVRKAIEEYDARKRKESIPDRIKSRYADFDAVVTEDNVKQLRAMDPEIAQALSQIGDEEAKAVAAYKYIKAFLPSVEQAQEAQAAKQQMQQNANKPKTLGAVAADSPLAKADAFANGLTAELKRQLYAETVACAKKG